MVSSISVGLSPVELPIEIDYQSLPDGWSYEDGVISASSGTWVAYSGESRLFRISYEEFSYPDSDTVVDIYQENGSSSSGVATVKLGSPDMEWEKFEVVVMCGLVQVRHRKGTPVKIRNLSIK